MGENESHIMDGTVLSHLRYYEQQFDERNGIHAAYFDRALETNTTSLNIFNNITYQTHSTKTSFSVQFFPSHEMSREDILHSIFLALSALAYQPKVFSISATPPIEAFNLDANYIIQGGSTSSDEPFHKAHI